MSTQTAASRRLPDIRFRVLIAGRANAGKTSILQRVCDTTESPKTYRVTVVEGKKTRTEIHLDPSSEAYYTLSSSSPVNCVFSQRGQHDISDELEFTNHMGYVFHDSRGFECGTTSELKIIQDFVHDRSQRKRLQERLHAIWYCIPMDDQRPSLDIAPFHEICPDKNVPIIAVFTKFEAFRHNIQLDLEDDDERQQVNPQDECERIFKAEYLGRLGKGPKFVRLEGMDKSNARCDNLIGTTLEVLDPATVALMLLAVQVQNLELNIQYVVRRISSWALPGERGTQDVIKYCLSGFPILWVGRESLSLSLLPCRHLLI
ncbi:hypothetical protein B0H14DRAFT_1492273 [Mycena olivaceomarginata]|nr:hypothetical protein B0H14DRAFT_1492273 [Mycena olivaceomarginata]